jgi:hypothetical protein
LCHMVVNYHADYKFGHPLRVMPAMKATDGLRIHRGADRAPSQATSNSIPQPAHYQFFQGLNKYEESLYLRGSGTFPVFPNPSLTGLTCLGRKR